VGSTRDDVELLSRGMRAFVDRYEDGFGLLPPGVRDQRLENDGRALAASLLSGERRPDISEQLVQMSLPTLIFCGTEDEPFELAQHASEMIPGARFLPLQGLNHPQVFRQSDLIVPHIRQFLSQFRVPD
jgi:pimeloyl-ACP methyl ester carboxylesterase